MSILYRLFSFIAPKTLNYLVFTSFDFVCTWWMLFQKRHVRTEFDIYVFFLINSVLFRNKYDHLSNNSVLFCIYLIILCYFVINMTIYLIILYYFVINMTIYLLILYYFVINMTIYLLILYYFVINMTIYLLILYYFVINMTIYLIILYYFVINMTIYLIKKTYISNLSNAFLGITFIKYVQSNIEKFYKYI